VTIAEGERHELGDGDRVRFEEVEGMAQLNGCSFTVAEVVSARQFRIDCDTRAFGEYQAVNRCGYGNQEIRPKVVSSRQFDDALSAPDAFPEPFDFNAWGRDRQVVLAFPASHRVLERGGSEPDDLLTAAGEFGIVDEVDKTLLTEFAREQGAVIGPTCAAFGGIVGHEVLKAVSHKFTPMQQFLGVGYVEALPPPPIDFRPLHDRYDPYRQVFGNARQAVMQGLRYFMIGAGALGCEQLKNWAMMGVGTTGQIWVTDMDQIERSNLNRQFLFRDSDIGKMKSSAAAAAATVMNPAIRIEAPSNQIGPESAAMYHDEFYQGLSGVCNALDNIATRVFSDAQCVRYKRPLLESGTLGSKAHMQIIIPDMTESYGSQVDPPDKGIPMCTLHHFPSTIDHTCMWARDVFSGIFEQQPHSVNSFVGGTLDIDRLRKDDPGTLVSTLKAAQEYLINQPIRDFDDCVRWARMKFEELFNFNIRDLRAQFPLDAQTSQGLPFWGGAKRFPEPATFDPQNEFHAQFVTAAATLRARVFGVPADGAVPERAADVDVPAWSQSGRAISLDDNAPRPDAVNDFVRIDELLRELPPFAGSAKRFIVEEFEKDNDANSHMAFIASAANIRALNYQIEPQNTMALKKIAGNIIPAIATTTAMICGFVALEMYKVHAIIPKTITDFRFAIINLAINMYSLSEPRPCQVQTCPANGEEYSLWTTWQIDGDLTLGEFIQAVKEKYKVSIDMVTIGHLLIYTSWRQAPERLQMKITDIRTEYNLPPLAPGQNIIPLDATCSDDDGEPVDTPPFVLKVR
jgi:ubiquitin-activating enzyme E1